MDRSLHCGLPGVREEERHSPSPAQRDHGSEPISGPMFQCLLAHVGQWVGVCALFSMRTT